MIGIFLPGLIIFGVLALVCISDNIADAVRTYSDKKNKANEANEANEANKAWDIKFFKEDLEELFDRVRSLENTRRENQIALNDAKKIESRLDVVDNWRKNVLKGYCFKRIEFEEKENKAHFLVVCNQGKGRGLHTKHVECELVSKFSAQECIKKFAVPITIEQANDYFDNGFEWVPAYEKNADWPKMT